MMRRPSPPISFRRIFSHLGAFFAGAFVMLVPSLIPAKRLPACVTEDLKEVANATGTIAKLTQELCGGYGYSNIGTVSLTDKEPTLPRTYFRSRVARVMQIYSGMATKKLVIAAADIQGVCKRVERVGNIDVIEEIGSAAGP